MLRTSVLALLLLTAPAVADDEWLKQLFKGNGHPALVETDDGDTSVDGYEDTTPHDDDASAEHNDEIEEIDEPTGYDVDYADDMPIDPTNVYDPRSPAYIPPATLDDDYDPEGSDKYLLSGYPKEGEPGYEEYLLWLNPDPEQD